MKEEELYWSLSIEPSWVQAGVWSVEESGNVKVFAVSPGVSWDEENLPQSVDTALSSVVSKLPEGYPEPEKTVFGVLPSWVSQGELKPAHLEKLKTICSKLSLKPHGFVVLPEAISFYYKIKEGVPLNAVVIGISKDSIDVSLFDIGNLVGSVSVAKSVSLFDDVVEALTRFGAKTPLPSRFLVYDSKEGVLEDATQALAGASWEGNGELVKFLHTPKVEEITPEEKIVAISLSGASETTHVSSVSLEEGGGRTEEKRSEVSPISFEEKKEEIKLSPQGENEKVLDAKEVGFGMDMPSAKKEAIRPEEAPLVVKQKRQVLSGLFAKFKGIKVRLPAPGGDMQTSRVLGFGAGVIVLFLGVFFAAWWFLPKAVITIYVSPKTLEKKETLLVSSKIASADIPEKIIPGEVIETEVSGEKTTSTTGAKTIGDKASGEVTIRNGTSSNVKLSSGSIITSSGEGKFELSQAASVSSATSPSSPGTAQVKVVAENIGSQYNLAKDSLFKVANYPQSEVDAVATGDFSGGASREIQAVAKEDVDSLQKDLEAELLEKGKNDLRSKTDQGQSFLEDSVSVNIAKKDASNEVGDEAATLKLSMTAKVIGLAVSKEDISLYYRDVLGPQVPDGFVLRDDQVEAQFLLESEKDGRYELQVILSANLLPSVDIEEVKKRLSGKFPGVAQEYLGTIPGYSGAEIAISPRLPGKLGVIPHITKRIEIEVASKK